MLQGHETWTRRWVHYIGFRSVQKSCHSFRGNLISVSVALCVAPGFMVCAHNEEA